ncbi:MAG: PIN domain-containing protein [Actinobacteria bacterium]|nr:PIN domain-containing protein [Actinomycetota bacterium]MCB8997171.1 PIN domain-containing protein [Actinomycetota bacterium]MCB9425218.1 PIN domain-containing protein [Actinomycetota bacterium]HRY10058.1 PIN domain-containing protein [Candidatus Nanopelagicales bacterium]
MTVFDASALLAYLGAEDGADTVESALERGGMCSTANWSEVAQKVLAAGGDWDLSRALLLSYGITLGPVDADDAEWAARRWRKGEGLSLGERLCLALAHRLDDVAITADRTWGEDARIHQIR